MTRLLAVYDGNNALIMRFEYADARMPFAMTMSGAVYYLAYDQVGSLRVVADASGNPVKQIDYDSFGNVFCDSAPAFPVPFGFAGGLYDKDTKLVRFGYRDYDPDTGRWTAKDPIGFEGGDTDLYGYCVGDPINHIDPTGRIAWVPIIIGGLIIGDIIADVYASLNEKTFIDSEMNVTVSDAVTVTPSIIPIQLDLQFDGCSTGKTNWNLAITLSGDTHDISPREPETFLEKILYPILYPINVNRRNNIPDA